MGLVYSQYDLHVKQNTQSLVEKLQGKSDLSQDDAEFVNSLMRSLIVLSKEYQEDSLRALRNKIMTLDSNC